MTHQEALVIFGYCTYCAQSERVGAITGACAECRAMLGWTRPEPVFGAVAPLGIEAAQLLRTQLIREPGEAS